MKVTVDQAVCTGHAQCGALAPDVYDLDDQGFCLLRFSEVPEELHEQARTGADACPERAISIAE